MTLLGKLFRPWDLPVDESSERSETSCQEIKSTVLSEESDKVSSPDVFSDLNHCFNFGHKKDTLNPSIVKTHTGNASLQNQSVRNFLMGNCSPKSDIMDSVSRSPEKNHEFAMFNSDFDLNTAFDGNQTSPLFLHPRAINDLANLSRNELTAMGLLPPDAPATLKVKRQRPKRFHCPHCQVAFSNNGQLRGHVRIHTGERPFSCEHEGCGKSFTRNEELTRHRRIHSGLRPFPCTYCGKKFGRKDHLKKHTRTHQRPMYSTPAGMIGFGNPFNPFNPPLISSHSSLNEFSSVQSTYALPFVLSMPPPMSHFPYS